MVYTFAPVIEDCADIRLYDVHRLILHQSTLQTLLECRFRRIQRSHPRPAYVAVLYRNRHDIHFSIIYWINPLYVLIFITIH